MKVMGIAAGRRNGNSEILVKEALLACQEAGADCTLINLFDYNIEPCTGCEACTMSMGDAAQGKGEYKGCVLKDKDDMDKIMKVLHQQNGIIVGCPTYDLMPSALYTKFAQRFLAYELAFLLKIGAVKHDPHLVAGLIGVGGSCHDWQGFALETLAATMFTQSIQVIDQFLSTRVGRPGNVLLREEQIKRAHQMGENIVKSINTSHEKREWLGDPDLGLCPNCHGGLIFKGDEHWDGLKFPFECAVCGAGLDIIKDNNGEITFELVEDGLSRDRNVNECRELHLDEIIETRIHFFQNIPSVQERYKKYKELTFNTI